MTVPNPDPTDTSHGGPIPFRAANGERSVLTDELSYFRDHDGGDHPLAALCLSGGGIRSASFAMGVVSALAKRGLLDRFHYLSTVSGGGYTGSWLSAWIRRHGKGLKGVIEDLTRAAEKDPKLPNPAASSAERETGKGTQADVAALPFAAGRQEPEPVRWVRTYSSYLSPRIGLLSPDTWTLLGIYLRNLLVHWFIVLPLIGALLMVPWAVHGLGLLVQFSVWPQLWPYLLALSFLLTSLGLAFLHRMAPNALDGSAANHRHLVGNERKELQFGPGTKTMWTFGGGPLLAGMTLLSWCLLALVRPNGPADLSKVSQIFNTWSCLQTVAWAIAFGASASFVGWICGRAPMFLTDFQRTRKDREEQAEEGSKSGNESVAKTAADTDLWKLCKAHAYYGAAATAAGAIGGAIAGLIGAYVLSLAPLKTAPTPPDVSWPVVVGPLLLVLSFILPGALFIGLVSDQSGAQDRDWWASIGSAILFAVVTGTGWVLISLCGPDLAKWVVEQAHQTSWLSGGVAGLITIVSAVWAAFGPATDGLQERDRPHSLAGRSLDVVVKVAAPLALLILAIGGSCAMGALLTNSFPLAAYTLSHGLLMAALPCIAFVLIASLAALNWVLLLVGCWAPGAVLARTFSFALDRMTHDQHVAAPLLSAIGLTALLAAASYTLARGIKLRAFTLHEMYRERLARTFLGATNTNVMSLPKRQQASGRVPNALTGFDPADDIAVIRAQGVSGLTPIEIGSSKDLQVGENVVAIGSPLGLQGTVTTGIVSALNRPVSAGEASSESSFINAIQTDAAINPGNSGGALVDVNGNLLGINTAIYSRSGGSMGIGFAIPVSTARLVMDSIVKDGQVTRGWIGVEPQDLSPELAETFGVKPRDGVIITGVLQNGPAAQAGIQPGDVITGVAGDQVTNVSELLSRVAALKPGTPARFALVRREEKVEVTVTPGLRPKPKTAK